MQKKSHLETDDDWGYPYDSGHLHIVSGGSETKNDRSMTWTVNDLSGNQSEFQATTRIVRSFSDPTHILPAISLRSPTPDICIFFFVAMERAHSNPLYSLRFPSYRREFTNLPGMNWLLTTVTSWFMKPWTIVIVFLHYSCNPIIIDCHPNILPLYSRCTQHCVHYGNCFHFCVSIIFPVLVNCIHYTQHSHDNSTIFIPNKFPSYSRYILIIFQYHRIWFW